MEGRSIVPIVILISGRGRVVPLDKIMDDKDVIGFSIISLLIIVVDQILDTLGLLSDLLGLLISILLWFNILSLNRRLSLAYP